MNRKTLTALLGAVVLALAASGVALAAGIWTGGQRAGQDAE